VELRFGPYTPNVDEQFEGSGQTPYKDAFGKKARLIWGIEADYQALRIPYAGTLGLGGGWHYTGSKADAPFEGTDEKSGEETALRIMPMYAVGVLRLDVLARETKVPLVLYGKGGLGYALWWTQSGGMLERDATGQRGRGVSYGTHFAVGAMLLLDPLDPVSATDADISLGVNNTYLFAEWYSSDLDGFGGDRMQVGDRNFMFGLAWEI
jgi:hypothetical protein